MADKNYKKILLHGTVIIVVVSLLAKVSSFIAEAILAYYLGTTDQSDAYYMVSSIQMVFYPMLSVGIWKVFLPIYKEKIAKNEFEEAGLLANNVITIFTVFTMVAVLLLVLFSDYVVLLIAPGFSTETKALCSKLVRISSPMYIFIIASAVYSVMLQCHNRFLGSQIREVASHIPTIIAAIFLYKKWGIVSLAIALIVGGVLRLLIELPFVNWGYKYKICLSFRDAEIGKMLKRLPSAMMSEGIVQINTLVDKVMASTLPIGAVSSLHYANKLMNVLNGLLSAAVATALYPQVVELIALNKKEKLSTTITKVIHVFEFIMIPVSVGCFFYAREIVSIIFERGAFTASSAEITTDVFRFYAIGLFFLACNTILTNVFYGYGDTKTPMYLSIVNLVINVLGNLVFVSIYGALGLAFATSLSACITFFVRLFWVRKYIALDVAHLIKTMISIIILSLVSCGIATIITSRLSFHIFFELLIAVLIAIPMYILLTYLFKVSEFKYIIELLTSKKNDN